MTLADNVEKYDRARQNTDDKVIGLMRLDYWITKATNTHAEYITLVAVTRQQWLRECASLLRLSTLHLLL